MEDLHSKPPSDKCFPCFLLVNHLWDYYYANFE